MIGFNINLCGDFILDGLDQLVECASVRLEDGEFLTGQLLVNQVRNFGHLGFVCAIWGQNHEREVDVGTIPVDVLSESNGHNVDVVGFSDGGRGGENPAVDGCGA